METHAFLPQQPDLNWENEEVRAEFDDIFGRIKERGLAYWADPGRRRPGELNTNDGGRGVYWEEPGGHFLEIITRPYGSGG